MASKASSVATFDLPNAPVARIMKRALPESVQIGKNVKDVVAKISGLFILYIMNAAHSNAVSNSRSQVSAEVSVCINKIINFYSTYV